jgi:hypothetical protein
MNHLEWLHPDYIILANSSSESIYKEFTKDMRSRKYSKLRLIESLNINYIRYVIGDLKKWYQCQIYQKKGKDYYIYISTCEDKKKLERMYLKYDREDKLNELLK